MSTKKEFRTVLSSFEVREAAGDSGKKAPVIMGYAARFNELSDPIGGMFCEKIASGAFDEAIITSDPRALFNHDPNHVLGRKSAGTLRLKILSDGLHYEITPPKSTFVADLIESMKRGDIKESSFAFSVTDEEWIDPTKKGDLPTRVIKRVGTLYDVSPVTYPAYPTATSEARSAKDVLSGYKRKQADPLIDGFPERGPWESYAKPKKQPTGTEQMQRRVETQAEREAREEDFRQKKRLLLKLDGKTEEEINMIETQEKNEQRTFGEYLFQVRRGGPEEERAATGQNVTTDVDGGFLVAPEYGKKLLQLIESESVLYSRVNRIPMSVGNTYVENYIEAKSRADGQRNGQIQSYWLDEAAQYTPSKLQFGQKSKTLSKLTGLCYATDEALDDAPMLESIITKAFRDEFAFVIDSAILNGDGASRNPLGILNSPALVTVAAESGQAAGSVVAANVLNMWNAMVSQNRKNAVWLISQDLEPLLIQMYIAVGTSGGVPVYMPSTGLAGAQYGTLMGRPVIPMEQCSEPGTTGDILLVDPTAYNWIEKGNLKGDTSIHVKFVTGEVAYRFSLRGTGFPAWDTPITPYKGATARSPYVALAPRA